MTIFSTRLGITVRLISKNDFINYQEMKVAILNDLQLLKFGILFLLELTDEVVATGKLCFQVKDAIKLVAG